MERHERQDRSHARAVCAGIAVSVAVHAAAFALIRFSVPALDVAWEDRVADAPDEAVPEVIEPAMQVVALREAPVADAAAPSSAPAVQAEAPAAPAAEAALAVAEVVEVPAAALPSAEPDAAPGGAVLAGEPDAAVAVAEAVEAEPAEADEEEAEEYALPPGVVMHVPGSVGRAKGEWGAAGGNGDEERRGRGISIRVTKCPPLPGRGVPPIMRRPVNHHLVHPAGW